MLLLLGIFIFIKIRRQKTAECGGYSKSSDTPEILSENTTDLPANPPGFTTVDDAAGGCELHQIPGNHEPREEGVSVRGMAQTAYLTTYPPEVPVEYQGKL